MILKPSCARFALGAQAACPGCHRQHLPWTDLTEKALADRFILLGNVLLLLRSFDFVTSHSEGDKAARREELGFELSIHC